MLALVTFNRLQMIPGCTRWKNQAVSPIGVVRHQAAAGWTADQGTQVCQPLNFGKFLEISEGYGRLGQFVKAQDRPSDFRSGFQEKLVQRHILRSGPRAGEQEKPDITS